MFDTTEWQREMLGKMQSKLFDSMQRDLRDIFYSSGIRIPPKVAHSIGAVMQDIFSLDPQSPTGVTLKKAPKDFGDKDDQAIYNVIPGTNRIIHPTDTLVVYCLGRDSLNTRLKGALDAVRRHRFEDVIFVTSKWDISVITGNNAQRLLDLIDFMQDGTRFCFVLLSTSGISMIPVITY